MKGTRDHSSFFIWHFNNIDLYILINTFPLTESRIERLSSILTITLEKGTDAKGLPARRADSLNKNKNGKLNHPM